jgi:hypothetical protein
MLSGKWFQAIFPVNVLYHIARINRLQYGKLQKAKMCPSFDRNEVHTASSNFKTLIKN